MNRARREIPTWVQFASQTEPKQELQAPADLIQLGLHAPGLRPLKNLT